MVLVQQVTYRINNFEMAGCIPVSSTFDPIELMFLREKKERQKCDALLIPHLVSATPLHHYSLLLHYYGAAKEGKFSCFVWLSLSPPVRSLTLRVFPFHPISKKEMMWMCRCLILQQKARFGTC